MINAAAANGQQTAIVIGINQAEDRDTEYTPFVNAENPGAHGDKFAQWVVTELKAWVKFTFRTKPEASATTIGGISRSGMMAYYMLLAHPEVFGNAIIQSPSMGVDYQALMDMKIPATALKNKKIFISVGENEGRIMVPHARNVYEKIKALGFTERQLRLEIIPGEGHWHITWRKSFALAYPWLMD